MREAMAEALEDVKGVDAEEVLEATEEEGVEPEAEDKESEDIADLLEGELKKMRGGSEDSSEANTSVAEEESSETEDSPAEDEDEDAFVANLSERAQARFRELADRARQAEESAAQIKQSGEELYRIMSESGVTPNDLTAYFEYYKANQEDLVQKYRGKFIVIKDKQVLGAYDDQLVAVTETEKAGYELGTFLVQKVEPGTGAYTQTFHSRVAIY